MLEIPQQSKRSEYLSSFLNSTRTLNCVRLFVRLFRVDAGCWRASV